MGQLTAHWGAKEAGWVEEEAVQKKQKELVDCFEAIEILLKRAEQELQKALNDNEKKLEDQATTHLAALAAASEERASHSKVKVAAAHEALRHEKSNRSTVEDKLARLEEQGRIATALALQVRKFQEERNKLVERLEAQDEQLQATQRKVEQLRLRLPTMDADGDEETVANKDSLVRASKLLMHVSTNTFVEQITIWFGLPFPSPQWRMLRYETFFFFYHWARTLFFFNPIY